MKLQESLEQVVARWRELSALLNDHPEPGSPAFTDMLREHHELQPLVEQVEALQAKQSELADLDALRSDPEADREMRALAEEEYYELRDRLPELEHGVTLLLLPRDEADARNAILEVRAGTGGEEAALFAAELFRMYQRYAQEHGWRFELLDYTETEIGGLKEASASISGRDVFSRLKFESGVHRVQRVPVTESGGRIHTSAATVAVLPEAEEVDVEIEEKDLRIDTFRSQGAGGQHVNTTDSAIRITHLPTGVVVQCQDEKSQLKNFDKALAELRTRIYNMEYEKYLNEMSKKRKTMVSTGDRSAKIRTYNYPQSRVTDHRINYTMYNLPVFMDGDIQEVIDQLTIAENAERLKSAAE